MAYVPGDLSSTKWHSHTSCSSTLSSFTGTLHVSAMSLSIPSSSYMAHHQLRDGLQAWELSTNYNRCMTLAIQSATSLSKNNVEICSFPEELQPPGTSASKPAKGSTLLMQFWFWLFVQEFTCTVVTAGSGSSTMRSKETDVPVLHPVSQHDAAYCSSL